MEIILEAVAKYSIQSYDKNSITIDNKAYTSSIFVSAQGVEINWDISSINELSESKIAPLSKLNPEVIIIGHNKPDLFIPTEIIAKLSQEKIGIECMSIGAASRTFNVLLSELRNVVIGFIIFSDKLLDYDTPI
ncbi:MAG: hypothetical protein A3E88_04960 [Legionellales bacterium RIFCSPHIGHO2_12_FULL_35_11]|nr:MAG: hypothetical protein A3E88_04960 [Legionellales bacterium RIFCSPHIGHO2_12_FULL_35_11]